MTALVFGIVRSAEAGWGDAFTLASLAAGILLLAFFIWNPAHADEAVTCCVPERWRGSRRQCPGRQYEQTTTHAAHTQRPGAGP
jgi:hypothetical protein